MCSDQVLRDVIEEQKEGLEESYEETMEIITKYKHLIDPDKFTLELYTKA